MQDWNLFDLLPGLYVVALALGLAALLERLGERLSCLAWLFLLGAVLVPLAPVLLGGQLLLPLDNLRGAAPFQGLPATEPHGNPLQGDLIQLIAPLSKTVKEDLLDGRWPLWNDHFGAGMPLLADPQAQSFQPLVFLAYPFPWQQAAGVTAALRILVAVVFLALLFRRLGLGEGPSVAGALAYGWGGFLQLWLGWPLANTAAWLPVVLWASSRCVAKPGRRQEALLTLCLLGLLLAGHPETILYAGLFSGGFVVSLLVRETSPNRRLAARRLAAAGGLSLLLATPVLLPFGEYLPKTWRVVTLGSSFSAGTPSPAQALMPVVAPNTFGNSRYVHYWGFQNSNEDASGFAGTATLIAAMLAAFLGWGRRMPAEGWVLAVLGGIVLFLALGSLAGVMPFGWFHGGGRLRMLLPFCLAFLAACGLNRARRGVSEGIVLVLGSLGLALLLVWAFKAFHSPGGDDVLAVLRHGWLLWQLRFLVAAVLLLLLAPKKKWQPWIMALLIGGELYLAHGPANPPMPKRLTQPYSALLASVSPPVNEARPRLVALGPALPANLSVLYGLQDPRIYNPMEPAAYAALLAPLLAQPRGNVPQAAARDHPLYDLLGVEYVLAGPEEASPPPLVLLGKNREGSLYRRPQPLPPVFLPSLVLGLQGRSWGDVVTTTPDFHQLAWVDDLLEREEIAESTGSSSIGSPPSLLFFPDGRPSGGESSANLRENPIDTEEWRPLKGCSSSAKILRQEDVRWEIRAELCEGRLLASRLFVGEGDLGWRLLVDGEPWPVRRTNGLFLGAWLPAGEHRLEILVRPRSFLLAALLAAIGLAVGLSRWLAPPKVLQA